MKLRNTLILVAVAGGLFGYLKFVDSKLPTTQELEQRKGQIVSLESVDRDHITSFTVRNSEGTMEFVKQDGVWRLTAPVKDRAESTELNMLFTSLEGLTGQELKNSKDVKASQKEFGVAKGDLSIKLNSAKPVEILFGKDTALEGRAYARIEGSDTIYVVSKALRDQLAKRLSDWRDRNLSELTLAEVGKFTLKTTKGEMEVEKSGAHWSLAKPLKARADDQKVSDLISSATTARIEDFITDVKDLGAYGLKEPRMTLTMSQVGGKEPIVLKIGAPKPEKQEDKDDKKDEKKEKEKGVAGADEKEEAAKPAPTQFIYASISSREGVFTVPASLESLVTMEPNDLRDQNIMRIQEASANRLTIEVPGKEKIVLEKTLAANQTTSEWVRKVNGKTNAPVNGTAVAKLLEDLATGKVTRFVADMASDLKGFGLDQPQVTVTVGDYSSEGTPETTPGELEQAKLLLGKFEGDAGYAKLADEPFIFAVPDTLRDQIWTDPLQWQPLAINSFKRDDVTTLEITRLGKPPLSLIKDKEKGWKLAKGEGAVNQVTVQSLVNTVSDLRAVRWLGATVPAKQGLERPNLVVSVGVGAEKPRKLSVGAITPENMWSATMEGKEGTFVINLPDFDALNASLLVEAKPSAEAAPAAPGGKPVTPAGATTPPVTVPPAADAPKAPDATPPGDAPKSTEVPANGAKPAPETGPKSSQ